VAPVSQQNFLLCRSCCVLCTLVTILDPLLYIT
jgi:hypothetical protein